MPSGTTCKRKAMALDTSEGCKKCGILHKSLKMMTDRGKQRELCQACMCAETMELSFQTPCGQHYCKGCGFLIESVGPNYYAPDRCSACFSKQGSYIQCEDFRKATSTCECEFCNNHYSQTLGKILQTKTSMEETVHFVQKNQMSISESDSDLDPPRKENQVEEEIRKTWEREQLALKRQLVTQDCPLVKWILRMLTNKDTSKTFYIGGVDISFIKGNSVDACAALIIISFPELKVVYKRLEMIQLTAPYIPGFLAFREVDSIIQVYKAMLKNAPCYKPDVIFVDGNGQLHPRGFGLACHLGVLLDVPCVGVAKTLIHVDGIEESAAHRAKKQSLRVGGDTFPLTTDSGDTLGMALRSTNSAPNPIYVSVGHKISLQSAVRLVHRCCKYRIPEPTRFADMYSRQYLANEERSPEEFIA